MLTNQKKLYVVLVHGFLRSKKSMEKIGRFLREQGYEVVNFHYSSIKYGVKDIANIFLSQEIKKLDPNRTIHFVTHSLGGIIVRYFLATHPLKNIGKIVTIAPPNQGSSLALFLSRYKIFNKILGPCLVDLSIGSLLLNELGLPNQNFGIIAGTKDGKVSPKQAKYSSNEPFVLVPYYHTFIMNAPEVKNLVVRFLETGTFHH